MAYMIPFLMIFAASIGIIGSLIGWGVFVVKLLRVRFSTGLGFKAALGLAFSTSVGGLLDWLHIITPNVVRSYLSIGLLITAVVTLQNLPSLRDYLVSSFGYFKRHKYLAIVAFLFVSVTTVKFATATSPGRFNLQDDYPAYLVFPVKMIQTGSLGPAPFSERRIVSSLGGKSFLDTFPLSLSGSVKNLRVMDEGVAFVIVLMLLAELMIRKKAPGHWILITLLAASMLPAPIANITALYSGIALLLLLFDFFDRSVAESGTYQIVFMALVLASLSSLKTSFAPMAGIFFISFYVVQLKLLPAKGRTIARAGICAALTIILLLPWMVDSYYSSGTLFYPIFGKGFHGSRYGYYYLPSANLGLHNILAFCLGLANTLCAVLAALVFSALLGSHQNRHDSLVERIVVLNLVIDLFLIGVSTGGYQVYRYSFAILFSSALFLLIKQVTGVAKPSGSGMALIPRSSVLVGFVSLGMLLGVGFDGFISEEKDGGIAALKFSLSGNDIVDTREASAYRDMQLSIPPGQKVMVRLDKNFLLDFRRNPIYINDLPGGASLPPGIPVFKGSEAVARYLTEHGIRYIAYSYGDEATFTKELFSGRLSPNVNIWIRRGAEITFDFQDNVVGLGRSRRRLFDDGKMFVVDLATPAGDDSRAKSDHLVPVNTYTTVPDQRDARATVDYSAKNQP
jgi:hypothetical protein